jgi:hypothetical protein
MCELWQQLNQQQCSGCHNTPVSRLLVLVLLLLLCVLHSV